MLKKRVGAALLSLCLALGLCTPAYALEAEASPETASRTEDGSPDPYALTAPAPGAALLALPRAADIVKQGTCGAEGDNLAWTLDADGTLTISGEGDMADYGYGKAPWYGSKNSIETLVVGDGVTSIGDDAFASCSSLAAVTIPKGVTSIGNVAFSRCISLTSVSVPDGVTYIGYSAFNGCSTLADINIPEGVTYIGSLSFHDCSSLTSITIPSSVASIGSGAFRGCTGLTELTVDPDNPEYTAVDGILFDKNQTTLYYCPGKLMGTSYEIPGGVVELRSDAFSDCDRLAEITVAPGNPSFTAVNGVLLQDSYSWGTELVFCPRGYAKGFYEIPDSVTYIQAHAFSGCTGLTGVSIPDGVSFIGMSAFEGCVSLGSVSIPDSVSTLMEFAFEGCSGLTTVSISGSIPLIKVATFQYCSSLATISIPDSVTAISDGAFNRCDSLKTVFYSGSKEDWQKIQIGGTHTFQNAAIHCSDGVIEPPLTPAPSISVLDTVQSGGSTAVTVSSAALAALPKPPVILAAALDGRHMTDANRGELTASPGEITFGIRLGKNDKLFFLDPDTLVPLAKPAILQ